MGMKNFGADRVIEPKGALPVTAWKLDNSRNLSPGEIRINVDYISVERDSMCQICSICEHNDEKLKERIFKFIAERGKLHNPYTDSGALFSGTIEEIAPGCEDKELAVGDYVAVMSTMTGIPLYIDEIEEVDYDLAQIKVKGYAICFDASIIEKCGQIPDNRRSYFRRALDEEGSFYGISLIVKEMQASQNKPKSALIIGVSLIEIILYAQLLKNYAPDISVSLLVETGCTCDSTMTQKNLSELLNPLVDKIYFDSMSNPMDAATRVSKGNGGEGMDIVVNLENIKNCESVAALLIKDGGLICHTNIDNNYSQTMLLCESLGKKDIINYSFDSVYDSTFDMAVQLLQETELYWKRYDEYLEKYRPKRKIVKGNAKENGELTTKQIDDFIYMSPVTADMVSDALNVAKYDCNVIIQGETGTGKERVFDLIQQNSPRKSKPCIKINCATIQENLAESEFFGYEKGSFTGALASGKQGYFELANNGTLFLDEIGSLPLSMQTKLLRVLQENTFYRVGGTAAIHVNVRVICANNIPLRKLIEEGKFREDLYYRLNICQIEVPPLRRRPDDIYCLAEAFAKRYSQKYGIEKNFSAAAYSKLQEYHWPGNVRELENTVHRLYISAKTEVIDAEMVDDLLNENVYDESVIDIKKEFKREGSLDFNEIMEQQEKKLIEYALKKEGTTRKAADFLNIPQTTLARKKIKHNL